MNNNHLDNLKNAPALVKIFRGHHPDGEPIEKVPIAANLVVTGLNKPVFSRGDEKTLTHMRSCAKPLQVLPLLEMGFFDDCDLSQGLKPSDLALMMSSHAGRVFIPYEFRSCFKHMGWMLFIALWNSRASR